LHPLRSPSQLRLAGSLWLNVLGGELSGEVFLSEHFQIMRRHGHFFSTPPRPGPDPADKAATEHQDVATEHHRDPDGRGDD
jgi:hypothetical protein